MKTIKTDVFFESIIKKLKDDFKLVGIYPLYPLYPFFLPIKGLKILIDKLKNYLKQDMSELIDYSDALQRLFCIFDEMEKDNA